MGERRRLRLPVSLLCASLILVSCGDGGGDPENAPPANATLDAYVAHNAAVDVQERWQASDSDKAGLCSTFFDSPELAETLREHPGAIPVLEVSNEYDGVFLSVSAAEREAAAACADGSQLETWQSHDFDAQLADRKDAADDQEALDAEVAADFIDAAPGYCEMLHRKLAPLLSRSALRQATSLQNVISSSLSGPDSAIPDDADPDGVAQNLVLTCGTIHPDKAADALRSPDTPIDQLDP